MLRRRLLVLTAGVAGLAGCSSSGTQANQDISGSVRATDADVKVHSHTFQRDDGETTADGWVVGEVQLRASKSASIQVSANFLDDADVVFEENYTVLTDVRTDQRAEFEVSLSTSEPDRLVAYELTVEVV